jgi:PBSX family phage terminase large subunit
MLFGGSRSGKTFLIIWAIVLRALSAPMSRHAVLRFRFNHCKASVIYDTFPKVMELCYPDREYKLDKTDWFAQFSNGSQIWFGGLDDKERSEKILGQEHATIFLNECSQIPLSSRNLAVTRLAQQCDVVLGEDRKPLRLKMYYDCNPPSNAHWAYKLFVEKKHPETRRELDNSDNYAALMMNPADNVANLPQGYIDELKELPKRLRDRFLSGKWANAAANALWTTEILDRWRVKDETPDYQRIVVAVDPSGADDDENINNDEIGICVAPRS